MGKNTADDVRNVILTFVKDTSIADDISDFNDETNLLKFIDSFSFVEMIQHVEDSTGFKIDFADADPEDLICVRGIINYLSGANKK